MSFDMEEALAEVGALRSAMAFFDERSAVLWEPELGPLNSDAGHDALTGHREDWLAANPTASFGACIDWILSGWDEGTLPEAVDARELEEQLAREEEEGFDFYQEVYVLDETIIASALAQVMYTGAIDAVQRVEVAIERQAHPLVLARMFPPDGLELRRAALQEARRVLRAAART